MKKTTITALFLFLINLGFAQPDAPSMFPVDRVESDFFTDDSASFPPAQRITLVNNVGDDSTTLQTAIDYLTGLGGGVITISAGTWEFNEIRLRSNVHLMFDALAVVKPYETADVNSLPNLSVFRIGYTSVKSSNVSIRALSGQFKIDLTHLAKETRITPFNVKEAENFMVADCYIDDNGTIHAALNCSASKRNDIWTGPVKGLIKNLTSINAHGGYGVVQVRTGERLLFKDLTSLRGGVTLRLESDDVSASGGAIPLSVAKMSEISGYNIKCTEGNAAVMLQPWDATNGWVDVQKIQATGCMAAVRIDKAYLSTIGTFDPDSRITDVTTSYGTDAQVKQGVHPWVPCVLRMNPAILRPNPIPDMETYHLGPSIAPLLYRASTTGGATGNGYYSVNVPTSTELMNKATGFNWSVSLVISRDDNQVNTNNCPPLSVDSYDSVNNLKMYPNPISNEDGILTIDIPEVSNVAVDIYNVLGKNVLSNKYIQKSEIHINPSQLKLVKGIYLVKIQIDYKVVSRKLIVN
ncbi:putative secreted protein (Por secretion system target) [Mariniflexile fucanivorans]|uniref:Putative secreted protein (Por secretion system target) n=1 Tax=Mariniflexile fucanivorans TaxID=264023 RepID=A0A4R1RKZ5_9FLAO|nr:T9SS type A sorting domain-containing protein [Mariniflexile fucanivorans]TCL66864.1 putative secreted protein (Por secretion system target) [Mariniflexile fucanivorans]